MVTEAALTMGHQLGLQGFCVMIMLLQLFLNMTFSAHAWAVMSGPGMQTQ